MFSLEPLHKLTTLSLFDMMMLKQPNGMSKTVWNEQDC